MISRFQKKNVLLTDTSGPRFKSICYISLFLKIFIPFMAAVLLLRFMFPIIRVDGNSMEPTYSNGDTVISVALPLAPKIKNGDVIVFSNTETNGQNFIKRVEGIPGDTICIKNGILYRNGEPVDESFDTILNAGVFEYEYTICANEYFVLGDNRNESCDSRNIGLIDIKDIKYIIPE